MAEEPWYQRTGPDAAYVRENQYNRFLAQWNIQGEIYGFKPYRLKKLIHEKISSDMVAFGSWRGYATFGLEVSLLANISGAVMALRESELVLERERAARFVWQAWLKSPHYQRVLYRPGGRGVIIVKKEFEAMVEKINNVV